jgi:hypothetical protein
VRLGGNQIISRLGIWEHLLVANGEDCVGRKPYQEHQSGT